MYKRMIRLLLIFVMLVSLVVPAMAMDNGYSLPSPFEFTEENLQSAGWGVTLKYSAKESFFNHYHKHRNDRGVRARNPEEFLRMALDIFHDTRNNPHDYKVFTQQQRCGNTDSLKFVHKTNERFIIYNISTLKIWAFGGGYRSRWHNHKNKQ